MEHRETDTARPSPWQGVMVAGIGLPALRAAQACEELALPWQGSQGETGEALLARARRLGCDALHPGEAPPAVQLRLAQACQREGLAFIGPRETLIAAMCDDQAIRQLMREAGLPLSQAGQGATRLHLPVLVDRQTRALALVEHERLEEGDSLAPSDRLTPEQRAYLGQLAVQGARAVGLTGVATLSFTLEENRLGFAAMHPGLTGQEGLAEALTGLDLAVEQLRLVAGERLRRPRIGHMGHGPGRPGQARLCQLAAPEGRISGGPGVRLDQPSAAAVGEPVARLLVWGRDAAEVRRRARRVLAEWYRRQGGGSGPIAP
jgi:pyruvate carboxylase subunit A